MSKKISIYQYYFENQEIYTKMYGDKTIVFIQIGKFYEAYCNKTQGYLNLAELEPLLNIKYIDRSMNGDGKPSQFGINCVAITRNMSILIDKGYTIVLFDQKTSNGEDLERECAGVYSPGTYLSDRQMQDANYIMSVFIMEERQLTHNKSLYAVGMTLIDITTGSSIVHEFYSDKGDENFGLDELIRMIQTFRPVESIIYFKPDTDPDKEKVENLKNYIGLNALKNNYFYTYDKNTEDQMKLISDNIFKINYQNEYLSKIYNTGTQLNLNRKQSILEILNLENKTYITISLILILEYLTNHNPILLKNLLKPEFYIYDKHLILGNNAMEQLNIVDSNNLESYNIKIESLFDVVNKTSTPMGKRFLKEKLLNPISQQNKQLIIKRYNLIEELTRNDLYQDIKSELKNIHDVERLHRRMALGMIAPYEFSRLDNYYQATTRIISLVKNHHVPKGHVNPLKELLSDAMIKDFISYQLSYTNEFNMEELQSITNFNDLTKSIFKPGFYEKIDKLQEKIDFIQNSLISIKNYMTEIISARSKKSGAKDILELENNETTGYYFTISKTNERILKEEINKKKIHHIDLAIGESIKIKQCDITYIQLPKGRTKITLPTYTNETTKLANYLEKLSRMVKKQFIKSVVEKYQEHYVMMHNICKFIADIDFLVSGAIVAKDYYYCKPEIVSGPDDNCPSYLKATALRHPIIERLCNETEYIPNDAELGNIPGESGKNGVLLYGYNAIGKSSYMKAIGTAIILAQIGYYVPAEKFVYEPYMAIYARITGNDNIFKGLSSFALEMSELNSIIMRTEKQGLNTLVIGDEVCRGTEDTSGRAIVASTLVELSECNCSFIFSSHLHDIPEIDEVKALKNLKLYHLKAEFDEENDKLILNRKLTPGPGPSIYGLKVARYFIKNHKFLGRAEIIKKRLINEETINISDKSSNYNKELVVRNCVICHYAPTEDFHKELESHHIHFQMNCLSDGKIKEKPHLTKNKLYNLVVLCRKCHVRVHKKEIIIKGYIDTMSGPILDYHYDYNKTFENILFSSKKTTKKVTKQISIAE